MPTGTVKWFNNAKGYGFILPDEGGEDLFVHYTSIVMEGYKTLKAGQSVTFEVVKGGKGLHATNIRSPEGADGAASAESSEATASGNGQGDNDQASSAPTSDSELETYS